MPGKRKAKKLNTKENQDNIKKDLQKKRMEKRKQIQQRYAQNGGGSKVVQRSKADVSRAPAYKAEKIRSSNFHSTFPLTGSGNGFFDQVQLLNEMLSSKERKLAIEKVLSKATKGMNPEQAKAFVEQNKELIDKSYALDNWTNIANMKKASDEKNEKVYQLLDGLGIDRKYAFDREHINKEHGKYIRQNNELDSELKNLTEVVNLSKQLPEKRDKVGKMKLEAEAARQTVINQIKDDRTLTKPKRDKEVKMLEEMNFKDEDGIRAYRDNLQMKVDRFNNAKTAYDEAVKIRTEWENDIRRYDIVLNELKATGVENSDRAKELADLQRKLKQRKDIHGDFNNFILKEKVREEEYRTESDRVIKVAEEGMKKIKEINDEKFKMNEKMKTQMFKLQKFTDAEKSQIAENDFDKNRPKFEKMCDEYNRRGLAIKNEVHQLHNALSQLDGSWYQPYNSELRNIKYLWGHVEKALGKDALKEIRADKPFKWYDGIPEEELQEWRDNRREEEEDAE